MFIRNILYTLLIIILPHQTYSMKRVNNDSQEDISSNNALFLVSHENQLMADIKKNIFNFDPIALNAIISTEQASQLNAEQKNELHTTAKELKKQIAETQQKFAFFVTQTDNPAIKEKLAFKNEYKNIQKIPT